MTDEEVNEFLNIIYNTEDRLYPLIIRSGLKEGKEFNKYLKKLLYVEYLKDDLGLLKIAFESKTSDHKVFTLTRKGLDVYEKGGWLEHLRKEKNKKNRKEFMYWFGIFLPFLMLLVSIWAVKRDSLNQEDTLNKQNLQYKLLLQEELQPEIQNLTKKVDSVFLMIERNNLND
ncbi:hypothetical protein [Bizionia paragorgiae]|uniref:hypothetical protein n=1 Tax=Bizionia paragorgiae TaxID=283786 RepID=UPI003A90F934